MSVSHAPDRMMLLLQVLCLLGVVHAATTTTTATTSSTTTTSAYSSVFAIPTILTPYDRTSPKLSYSPVEGSFSVASVTDWGKLKDYSSTWTIYRDGGGMCTLNNRTIWIFNDANAYTSSGVFAGAATNSMSLANTFSNASLLTDFTIGPSVGYFPATPWWGTTESQYATSPSHRYALWTYTNCVQISATSAVHFFGLNKFSTTTSSTYYGNTMAIFGINESTGKINVTRPSEVFFPNTTYPYGSFANVVVNGYAYLFGVDKTYSSSLDVHLAQVYTGYITDITKYRYWNAGTKLYETTQPTPTARRQSAAIIQSGIAFSTGSMFYSEYHNAYLLIFFSNYVDNTFRLMSSPSPLGTWNVTSATLYKTTPGVAYNYGGLAHPEYFQSDSDVVGKSLMLHYSYQSSAGTYPKALTLTFA
ncbi:uncharacterized protein V1518DRAFT_317844 [Limtongia smithiae]|uniref:uncharacterized protein n=1 Tax=Limtongia smithiae TaxID=1125753 RepID=UPI0034CF5F1C